jgi:Ser-tRNA(Ala) deacylase AlaX
MLYNQSEARRSSVGRESTPERLPYSIIYFPLGSLMPGTTDAPEYDLFDYKDYDQTPLSLEDAIKKASELRGNSPDKIHRVVPADRNITTFQVDSVPVTEAYADLLSKLMRRWIGWGAKSIKK